jgi:hypothetical protein
MRQRKIQSLDLERPSDRALVLRAYFQLLSEGLDEDEAKKGAVTRACENWKSGEDKP